MMKVYWKKLSTLEQWAVGLTGSFVFVLAVVASVGGMSGAYHYFARSFSSDPAKACKDPRNAKLPYCQEMRFKKDAEWRELNGYQGGKSNPFTLYRK